MLKNILIATVLGSSSVAALPNSYFELKSIKTSNWEDTDLSKFKFKNEEGKDHSLSDWDATDVRDNDITLSFDNIINSSPVSDSIQQLTYMNLTQKLDDKFGSSEEDVFGTEGMFNYEAGSSDFLDNLNITILGQSSSSREKLNDPKNTFSEVFDMDIGQKDSFYLRISNKSSTDWSENKSYFDVTLNIMRYTITQNVSVKTYNISEWGDGGYTNRSEGWTNDFSLAFCWKDYASSWDDFTNVYKYMNITDFKNSNDFHFYLEGQDWYPYLLRIHTKGIDQINWDNPSKTGSSESFTWSYSKTDWGHSTLQKGSISIRVTHDTKYIYLDHKYSIYSDSAVSKVGAEAVITNMNLEMYD